MNILDKKDADIALGIKIGLIGFLVAVIGYTFSFFNFPTLSWVVALVGILIGFVGVIIHMVLFFRKLKKDLGY